MPRRNKRKLGQAPLTPQEMEREIGRRMEAHGSNANPPMPEQQQLKPASSPTPSIADSDETIQIYRSSSDTEESDRPSSTDSSSEIINVVDYDSDDEKTTSVPGRSSSESNTSDLECNTGSSKDALQRSSHSTSSSSASVDNDNGESSMWPAILRLIRNPGSMGNITPTVNLANEEEFDTFMTDLRTDFDTLNVQGDCSSSQVPSNEQGATSQGPVAPPSPSNAPSTSRGPVTPSSSKGLVPTPFTANKLVGPYLPVTDSGEIPWVTQQRPKKVRRVGSFGWRKGGKRVNPLPEDDKQKASTSSSSGSASSTAKDATTKLGSGEQDKSKGKIDAKFSTLAIINVMTTVKEKLRRMKLEGILKRPELPVQIHRPPMDEIIQKFCGGTNDPLYTTRRAMAELFYDEDIHSSLVEYHVHIIGEYQSTSKEAAVEYVDTILQVMLQFAGERSIITALIHLILKAQQFQIEQLHVEVWRDLLQAQQALKRANNVEGRDFEFSQN